MNALPLSYWEGVRLLAEPFELMKFTLIYDGDLPSAGNKSKPIIASRIRNVFHDQLADLWKTHVIFRQLARTARTKLTGFPLGRDGVYHPSVLSNFDDSVPSLNPGQTDFCAPINVPGAGSFIPAIRHSLYLACSVDILFLRHEEPFTLLKQGGDLDGRIKTLFDALRMPNPQDEYVGEPITADPLYVLLEDDALIYEFSLKSGRLLGTDSTKKHEVRLSVDVTIKVLRVFEQNLCLVGG